MTRISPSRGFGAKRPLALALELSLVVSLCVAVAPGAHAQERFGSPAQASQALVEAAKSDNIARVLAILGPQGRDIVASGDKVADKNARERFLAAYGAKNRVTEEGADKAVLVIGEEDWPFPVPLVRKDGQWQFDAVEGQREILSRRIGRNERNAIEVSLAFVQAQKEYAERDPQSTGLAVYAERIVSRPSKKDGLYWPTKQGEAASPLGELVASAAKEGYRPGSGQPYYGYYYKILRLQGADVPGGAQDYVVHGKMIGGFALVAYPAEYRNSGVMTFLVNHEGAVYQKDLGPQTSRIAARMNSYNPDSTWRKTAP